MSKKRRASPPEEREAPLTPAPLPVYRLFAHPLFLSQLKVLQDEVKRLKARDPQGYLKKNATKRLAAITHLIYQAIPQDPTRTEYRQGHTLGAAYSHWFRAKFFSQYRLFFRFDQASRIIVYVWVNDETTLRAYDSRADAYRVFSNMLGTGHPPDGWAALLQAASAIKGAESTEAEAEPE
jgi:toxin YhaV